MNKLVTTLCVACFAVACDWMDAKTPATPAHAEEGHSATPTIAPLPPSSPAADQQLVQRIRSALGSTTLSVDAKNVRIIRDGDNVILRGPVEDEEERRAVERIVGDIVGAAAVNNQTEIETDDMQGGLVQ